MVMLAAGVGGCAGGEQEASEAPARVSSNVTGCISSGTEANINAALVNPNDSAVLCKDAVFLLNGQVVFTAPGQQISTQGLPLDRHRATLRINSAGVANAIWGKNQSNILIQNIQVDGNRRTHGFAAENAALIVLGGITTGQGGAPTGQTVRSSVIYDTRSWSTFDILPDAQCDKITISGNTILWAGKPDGTWADGFTSHCGGSTLKDNLIVDATDGAIVLFGGANTVVQNNTIVTTNTRLLSGIAMANEGNYSGLQVVGNTIASAPAAFVANSWVPFTGIAVGMGYNVAWCGSHAAYSGASVINNTLQGPTFGYGFVANGVSNWTVTGNSSNAWHSGVQGSGVGCPGGVTPAAPAAFQRKSGNSSGVFQAQFQLAAVDHIQVDAAAPNTSWKAPTCSSGVFSGCSQISSAACSDGGGPWYGNWDESLAQVCRDVCALADRNQYCHWVPPTCTNGTFSGCARAGNTTCTDFGGSGYPNFAASDWNKCNTACALSNRNDYCQWQPATCADGRFSGCGRVGNPACSDYGGGSYPNWDSNQWEACASACALGDAQNSTADRNAYCAYAGPSCNRSTFVGCRTQNGAICYNTGGGSQFPSWNSGMATTCNDVCGRANRNSYCTTGQ